MVSNALMLSSERHSSLNLPQTHYIYWLIHAPDTS